MRRLTPNSHFRLHAWFQQANGELLLAEGKTTFDSTEAASALRRLLLTFPLPISACQSVQHSHPSLVHFLALSTPSRAFNPHSSVVGSRFSTTDF
jgi:hypothetical protein